MKIELKIKNKKQLSKEVREYNKLVGYKMDMIPDHIDDMITGTIFDSFVKSTDKVTTKSLLKVVSQSIKKFGMRHVNKETGKLCVFCNNCFTSKEKIDSAEKLPIAKIIAIGMAIMIILQDFTDDIHTILVDKDGDEK